MGIVSISEAIGNAKDAGLDLVEVASNTEPPVCKIMDYGKLKYDQKKKDQESKKKHSDWNLHSKRQDTFCGCRQVY